jgi:dynactin-4
MLVSYTYRSDEPSAEAAADGSPTKSTGPKGPETKTFAFYTVLDLGPIVPKEETKFDMDV